MNLRTFRKALKLHSGTISIGGGEPTVHPKFWQFLGEAIAEPDTEYVWLATNGKRKNIALALAKMAKTGVIGCRLSIDDFHDPIDDEVIKAFANGKGKSWEVAAYPNDCRGMTEPVTIINRGFATQLEEYRLGMKDECACEADGLFIKPNGDIRQCGCDNALVVGTVWNPPEFDYSGEEPDERTLCCNGLS